MIFLDLETTGFDPKSDKIIEFAAVKTDDDLNEIETLEFLVNPEKEIPEIVSQITNINQEVVDGEKTFNERIEEVKKFIGDEIIVGHNIQFDISFLQEYDLAIENKFIDTCYFANIALPPQKSYALEILSDVLNIEHKYKHRALGDVLASIDLMKILYSEISNFSESFWSELDKYKNKSESELFKLIFSLKDKNVEKLEKVEERESSDFNIQEDNALSRSNLDPSQGDFKLIQASDFKNILSLSSEFIKNGYILSIPQRFLQDFEERFKVENKEIITLYSAKDHISQEKLDKFLKKSEYDEYESLMLLKLIRNKVYDKALTQKDLNVHWGDDEVWQSLNQTHEERNKEIDKIRKDNTDKSFIISHEEIFKDEFEVSNEEKVLFLDIQEEDLDRIFGGTLCQKTFLNRLDDDLEKSFNLFFEKLANLFLEEDEEIDFYGKQVSLETVNSSSPEFLELQKEGLELGEKLHASYPDLRYFSGILTKFFNKDIAIRFVKINKERMVTLNVYPQEYQKILEDKLPKNSVFLGFSSAINNDFSFYKDLLGIVDEGKSFENKSIKIHLPKDEFPGAKNPEHMQEVKKEMVNIFNKHKGRIMVLCSSKKQIEDLFLYFALDEEWKDKRKFIAVGLSGGKHKILHTLNANDSAVFFCLKDFTDNIALAEIEFEAEVIVKIPFINGYDLLNKKRGELCENEFGDYVLPKSVLELQRSVRLVNAKNLYFLDNTIKNNWAKDFLRILR